jgi:hypothetical protein
MQPQTKLGLGVLLWKSDSAKEYRQDCQSHIVGGSARKGASSGDQASSALSSRIQFAQQGAEVLGDRGNQATGSSSIRKTRILPEVAKHLEKMGLAATKEAADPRAALAGLA